MRPGARQPPSATLVPRILLALPLGLAAFALMLQFSGHRRGPSSDSASFGLFNEREFMTRSDNLPRLERQIRKPGGSSPDQQPTRLPLPNNLGGNEWDLPQPDPAGPKVAFMVTTAETATQIRVWLAYHRAIGVSLFYLFAEGAAATPESLAVLRAEPGVKIILRDAELEDQQGKSRIWSESWLSAFFNKPCNHELFVKQSLNMETGIQLARTDGAEWVLHVDTDELIYPGGTRDYSLQQTLASVPKDVDLLVFPNYESLAENAEVEDPFLEVSLFKRNYAHVVSEFYFDSYATVSRGNPNYFTTYGNGKSAARIVDGLRPNGAHRWHNYDREPKEWTSEQAAVLHFTYNRFSDLKSRRDRCDCKPTKEDAERCFILPFDRMAFLEASLKSDEELMKFFKERLVWDGTETVLDLLRKGLFVRLYEPQLLMRGFMQVLERQGQLSAGADAGAGGNEKQRAGPREQEEEKKAVEKIDSAESAREIQRKQAVGNSGKEGKAAAESETNADSNADGSIKT